MKMEEKQTFKKLIVFDFDYTFVDVNSDIYVFEKSVPKLVEEIMQTRKFSSWTSLIDTMFLKLQKDYSFSKDQIENILGNMPYSKILREILEFCTKNDIYVAIVSDANTFFINSFLEGNDMSKYVNEIHTNKIEIIENYMRILPYTPTDKAHGCKRCSANQCKGEILDKLKEKLGSDIRTIYVGDGGNDLCPGLRLLENDGLFARFNQSMPRALGLYKKIKKIGEKNIKAKIVYWENMETVKAKMENIFT